ncbi:uncharacterized protein LOC123295031 [Chrysoperla carnea]|uniref:uncharacterized protein LOC123295031 n=1 Tax=Chrysoperla carnea TaxID=189513 RepID=UPI001D09094B|nr:uncharacterized protein LOC123295031 [Chrysoperla carnea]
MQRDKPFWFNCVKVSIIINLIFIKLTLCQSQLNRTENVTKFHGLSKNITMDISPESKLKLLVEPNNVTDSLLLNSDSENDRRCTERSNLKALYESKKKNYLSLINSDRNRILSQMQTVNEIIDSFSKTLNKKESRVTRSTVSRPKCSISKVKLENLQKEIQSIISNTTSKSEADRKCTLNFDDDNCQNLMKTIQCGLGHIKDGYLEAMSNQGSAKEVAKWKNAFDQLSHKFEKEKDNLIQSLSHEHQLELDKLHKEMQNLGKLLNTALENLEVNTAELCVMEIVQGLITEAVDHFKELRSTTMSVIVKQAYNHHKHSNPDEIDRVINISDFIQRLPQNGKVEAMQTFYKEMKEKEHLNSIRVLILNYTFGKSAISDSKITNEILKFIDPILSSFSDVIAFNRKDSEFNQFLRLKFGNYFNYYSKKIITNACSKQSPDETKRLKNILENIRNFPYYDQVADGISHLNGYIISHNLLENRNTLSLIYYINYFKTKLSASNNTKLIENLVEKLGNELDKLPKQMVNFIVRPNGCKLRNKAYLQYLYADGRFLLWSDIGSDRHNVFLWKWQTATDPAGILEPESKWKFETSNNCETFTLKNVQYNEYLYVSNNWDNIGTTNPKREVFTKQQPDDISQAEWEIVPRNGGQYFTLKNVFKNEYFHADSLDDGVFMGIRFYKDNGRRRVFTLKTGVPTGDLWRASLWEIQC